MGMTTVESFERDEELGAEQICWAVILWKIVLSDPRQFDSALRRADPRILRIAGVFSLPEFACAFWLITSSDGQLTGAILFMEFAPTAGG